jgi:myosin heavy subunit
LFENSSTGIFAVLNDSMKIPNATDHKFADALYLKAAKSPHFVASDLQRANHSFTIRHYAFDVEYSVDNILEKNRGMREINFTTLALLQTGGVATYNTDNSDFVGSRSKAHASVESDPALLLSLLSTSSSTSVNSNDSGCTSAGSKRSLHRSVTYADDKKFREVKTTVGKKTKTISSCFVSDMDGLISHLKTTRSHFIRCIRPNTNQQPGVFNKADVTRQMLSGGNLEAVQVIRDGLPHRFSYQLFVSKYRALSYCIGMCNLSSHFFDSLQRAQLTSSQSDWRYAAMHLIDLAPLAGMILSVVLSNDDVLRNNHSAFEGLKFGKTCVLMSTPSFENLEHVRLRTTELIARRFQRVWKARQISRMGNTGIRYVILHSLICFSDSALKRARSRVLAAVAVQRRLRVFLAVKLIHKLKKKVIEDQMKTQMSLHSRRSSQPNKLLEYTPPPEVRVSPSLSLIYFYCDAASCLMLSYSSFLS